VRAIPERLLEAPWLEVTFPRVVGYRFDVPADRLRASFDATHRVVLTTQDMPTTTLNAPIVGAKTELTLEEAQELRPQTVAFLLATHLQQHHFADQPWLFPQLLAIAYCPDLIEKIDDGRGLADLLNLILEVSGQKKKEKEAKVQTARTMWVPAVNNLGAFGRWAFLEIDGSNLHKTKQEVRKLLAGGAN
jgi:hypothetical protein